jgi:hypothetical protein
MTRRIYFGVLDLLQNLYYKVLFDIRSFIGLVSKRVSFSKE